MKCVWRSCVRIGVTMCRLSSSPELTSGSIGVKTEKFSRLISVSSASPGRKPAFETLRNGDTAESATENDDPRRT